jgi:hypothetical protein
LVGLLCWWNRCTFGCDAKVSEPPSQLTYRWWSWGRMWRVCRLGRGWARGMPAVV